MIIFIFLFFFSLPLAIIVVVSSVLHVMYLLCKLNSLNN